MKTKLTNSLIGLFFAAGLVITGTESIVMKTYAEGPQEPLQSEAADTFRSASDEKSDEIISVYDTADDTVTLAQYSTEADGSAAAVLRPADDPAEPAESTTAVNTITAAEETAEDKQSEAAIEAAARERSAVRVIALIAAAIAVLLLAGMLVTILKQ